MSVIDDCKRLLMIGGRIPSRRNAVVFEYKMEIVWSSWSIGYAHAHNQGSPRMAPTRAPAPAYRSSVSRRKPAAGGCAQRAAPADRVESGDGGSVNKGNSGRESGGIPESGGHRTGGRSPI